MTTAAYGLRLTGVDGDELLAVRGGEGFPTVHLAREVGPVPHDDRMHFRGDRASLPVGDGRVHLKRSPAVARMRSPRPLTDDDVVHPWLSRVAATFGNWLDRAVMHGGAFVAGDAAWALLGDTQAGKSTLLAALASRGAVVLSDDVLVVEGGVVLTGPRCIDLRPDAAVATGLQGVRTARSGGRRRLHLDPAPAAVPLGGIVHLRWGERAQVLRVPLGQRIPRLRAQSWLGPLDPLSTHALFELAAAPTYELVRPRDLDGVGVSADALLRTAGA